MTIHRAAYAQPGAYPVLDDVAPIAEAFGLTALAIESEIGSPDSLVKLYGAVGSIAVAFSDPATVDGGPYPAGSLWWDVWDGDTTGELPARDRFLGDRFGLADSPAAAMGAVIGYLVMGGYARLDNLTLTETDWRIIP